MDTSKEYIKMCEQAKEIQKRRKYSSPFSGSAIALRGEGDFIFYDNDVKPKRIVWLPRQGQLQGMVFDKSKDVNASGLIEKFNNCLLYWAELGYCDNEKIDPSEWSMEQLWLAFVMEEKFNKVWNGNDWIERKPE